MIVMKFGGTSVGSAERMSATAQIIAASAKPVVVVLSAMSGITNKLISLAAGEADFKEILEHHYATTAALGVSQSVDSYLESLLASASTPAETVACGELMSTSIMTAYLRKEGVDAVLIPALDFMRVDSEAQPDIEAIATKVAKVLEHYGSHDVYVTQGFICRDSADRVGTLTRGGSDYTATLLGEALNASEIQIWTDVDGVYTADPRKVKDARCIPTLSYLLADTAARCGAKILHPDCVVPARRAGIEVKVLDSFHPQAGGTSIGPFENTGGFVAVAALEDSDTATVSLIGTGDIEGLHEAIPYALEVKLDVNAVRVVVPVARCSEAMNTLHRYIL